MGLRSNVRFAVQRLTGSERHCPHVADIAEVGQPEEVCGACVAAGDTWVHLRQCMTCGIVGCCDSSRNRHAHRHADEAGHPIARSAEPGEDWTWCFVDEMLIDRQA